MKHRMLLGLILLLAGAGLAGIVWPKSAQAGKPCSVPQAWGTLKAATFFHVGPMTGEHLIFEAADGTIRIINAECGDPPKVTVILRGE